MCGGVFWFFCSLVCGCCGCPCSVVGVWVLWIDLEVFFFGFPMWFLAVWCLEGEFVVSFVRFVDDLVQVFCGESLLGGGCCVCVPACRKWFVARYAA